MSPPDDRPFPYADYVRAQEALREALDGPCFYGLVVGASGTGKTSLARQLIAQGDRRRHQVVYVSSARASLSGIVQLLARRLHLRPRRSHLECVETLTQVLAAQTARLLLWLDEAEQVDLATLEQLRTLVEADPQTPSCSVVLAGQPALQSRLEATRLQPLWRRLRVHCRLTGLRRDELAPFVCHRFGAAAAQRLPQSVQDELFERTGAIPALLDKAVRRLLALPHHQGVINDDEAHAILDTAGL
jgi:type II secretory pathway predicted ATPase ExeA